MSDESVVTTRPRVASDPFGIPEGVKKDGFTQKWECIWSQLTGGVRAIDECKAEGWTEVVAPENLRGKDPRGRIDPKTGHVCLEDLQLMEIPTELLQPPTGTEGAGTVEEREEAFYDNALSEDAVMEVYGPDGKVIETKRGRGGRMRVDEHPWKKDE